MFDGFWSDGGGPLVRDFGAEGFGAYFPDIDITESEQYVDVTAEIPGLTGKDIKVNLFQDAETLTLEGEKRSERD